MRPRYLLRSGAKPVRSLLVPLVVVLGLVVAGCSDDASSSDDAGPGDDVSAATDTLARAAEATFPAEVGSLGLHDIHGGDQLTVVGQVTEPGERARAVAFRSTDARSWEVDPLPEPDAAVHQADKVAESGDVVFILGRAGFGLEPGPVLWIGQPGDWTLIDLREQFGTYRDVRFGDALAVEGGLVATVSLQSEEGPWSPHIWRIDPDGSTVEAGGLDGLEGRLASVATDGTRLVAGGEQGDPAAVSSPMLLVSDDNGSTWGMNDHQGLEGGTVRGLTYVGDHWWVTGHADGSGSGQAAFWASPDLQAWTLNNDPSIQASSWMREMHVHGDDVVILGSHVWIQAGTKVDRWWPRSDESPGSFSGGAVHNGQMAAIGEPRDGLPGMYLTNDATAEDWTRVELTDLVFDRTEGVMPYEPWHIALAGSGDQLVVASEQRSVDGRVLVSSLLAAAPDHDRLGGEVDFRGRFLDATYVEEVGFVAAGHVTTDAGTWDGARIAQSNDGGEWTMVGSNEPGDRAQVVLPLEDQVLVAGLTWTEGNVRSLLWTVTAAGGVAQTSPPGLDGYGALGGCAGGGLVVLEVFSGGEEVSLAVSVDEGNDFTVLDQVPVDGVSRLECAIDDEGRILTLAPDLGTPELHVVDQATGTGEQVASPGSAHAELDHVDYLPGVGWLALGSDASSDGEERVGAVFLSEDLESWTALGVESDGDSRVTSAAVSGDSLHVAGVDRDELAVWSRPVADLP